MMRMYDSLVVFPPCYSSRSIGQQQHILSGHDFGQLSSVGPTWFRHPLPRSLLRIYDPTREMCSVQTAARGEDGKITKRDWYFILNSFRTHSVKEDEK